MRMLGKPSHWRDVSPTNAVRDFIVLWRENPYRWRVLAVSIVLTATMIYGFIPESERAPPARPKVSYITSFAPDRTDAEIIAGNIEAQKRKEARLAEIEARRERSREAARKLARASGFDPDELERQYSDNPAPAPGEPAPAN